MKGIVFAGGRGIRLYPLTEDTNKHLLPVGGEPMILNPIRKMIDAGIRDILITTNPDHVGKFEDLLKNGENFGAAFTYRIQEEVSGTANALLLGEGFVNGEKVVVIYGDNITTTSLKPYVEEFSHQERGALILLKRVKDPQRFGIATVQGDRIVEIEEKPERPKSDLAITGYLMYNPDVFDIAKTLRLSVRGEYEMTDIYKEYMKRGDLKYQILEGDWIDAGTLESLAEADQMLSRKNLQ